MVKRIINKLKDIHKIEPGLITFRLILMLLEVAVLYINIIIPKFIMAELYDNNIFLAIIIIVIVLFINIVNAIIDRILSIKIKKKTENLNICLIDYFLRTTSKISITEYYNQNFFDDFTIAFEKTSEIYNNVLNISINYLKSIISITLISTTIFIYDTWVLTILTVFALINIYLYRFRNRYEYKFNYENIKNKRKLEYIYKLFTRTNYLRDLKLGDYKKYIFTKKNIFSIEFLNKYIENIKKILNYDCLKEIIKSIESTTILILFVYYIYITKYRIEDFFICINAYNSIKNSILELFLLNNEVVVNNMYIDKIEEVTTQANDFRTEKKLKVRKINIDNIKFSYSEDKNVFNRFSLEINKGDRILVRGRNGKGKSTLINLIIGLMIPQKGSIYFNGNRNLNTSKYKFESNTSYCFQNNSIYPFTIRENIVLDRDIKDENIYKLNHKILKKDIGLLNELDLYITGQFSDKGKDVSGGEAQYLNLLRTFINDREIIILDEPFNNLDENKVESIVKYINSIKDKIIIITDHSGKDINYTKIVDLNDMLS